MDWTQPLCDSCWQERNPGREPFRMVSGESEQCCICGQDTGSGIYERINPAKVPFPAAS